LTEIKLKKGEPVDKALRRLKKKPKVLGEEVRSFDGN
jgi:ribosomal protein S21